MLSAAAFQLVILRSSVILMIASNEESTMAANTLQISVCEAQRNGSGPGRVRPPANQQQGADVEQHGSRHGKMLGIANGREPKRERQDRRDEIGNKSR